MAIFIEQNRPDSRIAVIEHAHEEMLASRFLLDLGLTWPDLVGKRILDLGAGDANFASIAARRGVEVVSLDCIIGGAGNEGIVPKDSAYTLGDIRHLPFADNSFQMVLARAVVQMLPSPKDIIQTISEANRVLTENGEFRFGPGYIGEQILTPGECWELCFYDDRQRLQMMSQASKRFMRRLNFGITVKEGNCQKQSWSSYFFLMKKGGVN